MLQIGIVVLCAVFVVGYIFLLVSKEQDGAPKNEKLGPAPGDSGRDAA
ncbi:MAG: hypothetical protein AB7V55_02195 [Oscillospiraceae bacterium]